MKCGLAIIAIGLSACATAGDSVPPKIAVLTNSSAVVTADLERAVETAIGRPARLAPDVLTKSNILDIDPPFNDRSFAKPDRFYLQKRGNICELLHKGGRLHAIKSARCKPL